MHFGLQNKFPDSSEKFKILNPIAQCLGTAFVKVGGQLFGWLGNDCKQAGLKKPVVFCQKRNDLAHELHLSISN
jgi:hypothetical protein